MSDLEGQVVALHHRSLGRPADAVSTRIVLLHGFTQNSSCWGRFADRLAEVAAVTAVDLPGHGHSAHDDADLWTTAELVADVIRDVADGEPALVVGYSMGGRTALHLALAHPELVAGLVTIGATGGLDTEAERADRRAADEVLAARLEEIGLAAFLDRWLANPLFAGLDEAAAARAERLTNREAGLAASLCHVGTGTQEPLWDRLGSIEAPLLAIAGADDAKFTALGQRIVDAVGANASLHLEPGTHAVHLEQPDATADAILGWSAGWWERQ